MLGNRKIIVDEWAEVWDLLKPHADGSFWQWPDTPDADAVYIVGRVVLRDRWADIVAWATEHPGQVVFSNPAEGSETIRIFLHKRRNKKSSGARCRTRTGTPARATDFKSVVSTIPPSRQPEIIGIVFQLKGQSFSTF